MHDRQPLVFVRRPVVGLALAFIAGLFFGARHVPFLLLLALCGSLCGITVLAARSQLSTITLLAACAVLGSVRMRMYYGADLAQSLPAHLSREKQFIELIFQVKDSPQFFYDAQGRPAQIRFLGYVEAVRGLASFQPCRGVVSVELLRSSGTSEVAVIKHGQRWRAYGVIERSPKISSWLGPAHRFRVAADDAICVSDPKGLSLTRFCLDLRERCAARLSCGVGSNALETKFIKALLLGYRSDLDETVRDAFATTGTLHVLAVSGLHVGILVYLLLLILQVIGVPRHRCGGLLIPMLIGYAVMTGLRPSAVRACVMTGILLVGNALYRRPDVLTALAVAAIAMLFVNPGQLRDMGFVFSFLSVGALLVIVPQLRIAAKTLKEQKQEIEQWSLVATSKWDRVGQLIRQSVYRTLEASVAVWLTTTPLTIKWFHLCSPIAILGNLLVIPIAFLNIFTALLALTLGALHPILAEIFNYANVVFVRGLLAWVQMLMRVPGGYFRIADWPSSWIVLWYVLLFLAIVSRQHLRKIVFAGALLFLIATVVWGARERRATDVVVLSPVESGVVLIRGPGVQHVVVNAGPAYLARATVRSLRRFGVSQIDALILARPQADYVGAAPELFRAMPVREVWCGPNGVLSPATLKILREAQARGVRIRRIAAPKILRIGDLEFEILSPSGVVRPREGGKSVVFRVQRGRSAMLYAAGMTPATEHAMLSLPIDLAAGLLIIGGRDICDSYSAKWLDGVRPEAIVLNMGSEGTWVEPSLGVINRLCFRGVHLWRSERDGEAVWRMQPFRGRNGRTWVLNSAASTARGELL